MRPASRVLVCHRLNQSIILKLELPELKLQTVLLTHSTRVQEWICMVARSYRNLALDGGKWPDSRTGRFTPKEEAHTACPIMKLVGLQNRSGRFGEEAIVP